MTARGWEVRLTAAAEADFTEIIRWTTSRFGTHQACAYSKTLRLAIGALAEHGPEIIGAVNRDDIREGLKSLHVARNGRPGRHFVMYRLSEKDAARIIEILRILHDAMDLQEHL